MKRNVTEGTLERYLGNKVDVSMETSCQTWVKEGQEKSTGGSPGG